MSKLQVFAVFDSAVGAYMPPFTMKAVGEAVRAFISASEDPNHSFFRHAADYTLFHLGEWDENTGHFQGTPSGANQPIGTALELAGAANRQTTLREGNADHEREGPIDDDARASLRADPNGEARPITFGEEGLD